jgi:hypothetical protein
MATTSNPFGNTFNYYRPGWNYNSPSYSTSGAFGQTDIGKNYLEANRDAAFTRWIGEKGFQDNTPLGDYARAQRQKLFEGYGAGLGSNPDLLFYSKRPGFQTYLDDTLAGRIRNDFARLTPDQRGESFTRYAPRARQQMR